MMAQYCGNANDFKIKYMAMAKFYQYKLSEVFTNILS